MKTNRIKKALRKIEEAIGLLEELKQQANRERNYGDAGTFAHYLDELKNLVSSDHGEAGLERVAMMIAKKEERQPQLKLYRHKGRLVSIPED